MPRFVGTWAQLSERVNNLERQLSEAKKLRMGIERSMHDYRIDRDRLQEALEKIKKAAEKEPISRSVTIMDIIHDICKDALADSGGEEVK